MSTMCVLVLLTMRVHMRCRHMLVHMRGRCMRLHIRRRRMRVPTSIVGMRKCDLVAACAHAMLASPEVALDGSQDVSEP